MITMRKDNAVAPVVAVILILALTVMLAGIAGVTFISLASSTAGNINTSEIFPPTQNLNLLRITYDGNGYEGTVPLDTASYKPGDSVTVVGESEYNRDGYDFDGWRNKQSSSSTYFKAGSQFSIYENTILLAQWTKKKTTATLTYDSNSAEIIIWPTLIEIKEPPFTATLITPVSPSGQEFLGWSISPDGKEEYEGGSTFVVDKDITLYAQWSPVAP